MKKKSLICMFLLGLLCSFNVKAQVISGAQVISVTFPQSVNYFTSLSDNGLWATVGGTDPENTTIYAYPYLCNAQTGELIELWEGDNVVGIANDVTNDGKIVVGVYNNGPAYYDVDQKKWIQLEGKGIPTCITPDGKRIAGYYMGGDDGSGQGQSNEYPVVWDLEDGKYVFHEVSGKNGLYAETFPNRDKNNNLTQMFRIENMSADGKILAGAINFVYVNDACYYVFNTETGETKYVDNLCFDSPSGGHIDFSNMSNNGAYLTGNAWVIQGDEYTSAYRMDIANGTAELYNTYADEQDRAGQAVSNTGTVFASSPAVNVVRYMYIKHGKLWLGLDEIMSGRYGINIYDKINQETTGYAVDVSDDEKVLLAMSAPTATGYIIRLPETFSESASHIDPFDSYTVDPASGSSFARFRQGTITFAKPTTIKSGATGKLLDKNGGVFSTVNITPNSDGVSFNLSALPKLFTPGEEYTLVLPAGTFSLSADDSYQNSEIRLTYIGREDTPVRVLQVDPADGANVSEISTNQMVRIGFDMNVKVNTDEEGNAMVGYLYEADGTSPLCELVLSVNQNTLGMAPALRRYLRNGIDYKVVLPADAVTDMMGDCGNEEITINYHGLYEAGPTPTGDLFSDDFNDPSVSMATYLLYEGDHNTPASMPAGWGFDADNNPWNFTLRDDEQSDDYFAASHSMYNPADQSDDWMSLPQLQIDNADYYLSFNAQKYLSNKHDVLKVYVLAAEEGYTTFTDELKQRFLTEGDLVFDQELSFGQSQDRISTDWTEDTQFEIPLADYSGKSIYIAFVNQNDDQSVIFLDNIRVYYRGDFVLSSNTPENVVNQDNVTVSGQLNITGDETYNNLTATLTAGDFTSTFTANGLGLTKDSPAYTFEFPEEMPLTVGEENNYTITVEVDGNRLSRSGVVKDLAFETTKRVVVEEGTGQWCGNCPLGILALENLESLFGDKVISIGVHGGGTDNWRYDEYCTALGFTAYPMGRVNRINTLVAPAYEDFGEYSFNSPEGNGTFLDLVQSEFENNPYADADITLTKADYNPETRQIAIEGNLNYAVNLSSLNQNIAFVVLENGLSGNQNNYFYTNTDPLFGEFGQGGLYGSNNPTITFDHVAIRVVDNAFLGIQGLVPVSVTAGEPVPFSLERAAYDGVSNYGKAELVAMLLDNNTGLVVNAVKVPFTVNGELTGIGSVTTDGSDVNVAVNGGDITVNAAGEVNVAVYDASGTLVGNASGQGTVSVPANGKGLYIVKATASGASVVKKVMIR